MRRLIVDEPVSRAAVWSQRLAVFALFVAGVAILLARVHAADPPAALTVFAAALIIAGFALVLAGAAASIIWRDGLRGAGHAFLGFVLAAGLIAYPAYLAALAFALPKINDVSTDLASPPAFLFSARARAAGAGVEPPPPKARREPPSGPPTPTFRRSRSRWTRSRPIACRFRSPPTSAGGSSISCRPVRRAAAPQTIEAVDRTPVFGFPSDIVIRIRPGATSTAIDVRAVSRFGRHDFGAGAARIRKIIAGIKEEPVER